MGLVELLIVLAIIGLVLYVIETPLSMDASFKAIIRVVVVLVVLLWLVRAFVGDVPLPHLFERHL